MKRHILFIALLCCHFFVSAQQVRPLNSTKIYEQLKQLKNNTTILYLAAHPDDENTRLLSYLTHELNVETYYLSLTRGDGGQNLIGNELGTNLGLIRNYELIAAREIDGAKQLFTNYIDFGFSKSAEETFTIWDKQELIKQVIQIYQMVKPDIIICRFPTTGEGGHGQHTASAIVAKEAFEQLQKMQQKDNRYFLPQRVLFNAFQFGDRSTIKPEQFKIITNQYNSLIGESYGEMAGRSRSIHRSQGAGTPQSYGLNFEHFELMAGVPMTDKFLDYDYSWNRLGLPEVDSMIDQILTRFEFTHPEHIIPQLIQLRKYILSAPIEQSFYKDKKIKEIDLIIRSAAGIVSEITYNHPEIAGGDSIPLNLKVIARYPNVMLESIAWPGEVYTNHEPQSLIKRPQIHLSTDTSYQIQLGLRVSDNEQITQPYWLEHPAYKGVYNSPTLLGPPQSINTFVANLSFLIEGVVIDIQVPVSYKYLSPTKGDVVQPLRIVPKFQIKSVQSIVFYKPQEIQRLYYLIKSHLPNQSIQLNLTLNDKVVATQHLTIGSANKDTLIAIDVDPQYFKEDIQHFLLATIVANDKTYDKTQIRINYDHLPELVYYTPAYCKLVKSQWKSNNPKIGYVQGAGDNMVDLLKLLDQHVAIIPDNKLNDLAYLKEFDVLLTGIRAYNTNESLCKAYDVIMQYIEQGGRMVVQYNTSMNLLCNKIGPYPFEITRDRVTEENAIVTILEKTHSLLQYPNPIKNEDFKNWVQERGLYFPVEHKGHYQKILSMNDSGDPALDGAIIYTPYGKGSFTYTSLAFFRQIPEGNSGAIKLFLNLLH